MSFGFGESVTLITRTLAKDADGNVVRDADGNDVYTDTPTTLADIPVWPAGATELVQGQDTAITGLYALLPPGVDVSVVDAVTVYGDTYEVDGQPGRYASPFTGLNPGVLVHLTEVK